MKTGDTVKHEPTGETWTVAYVTDSRYLGWCGWPSGDVPVDQCKLLKECTFDEHIELLKRIAHRDDDTVTYDKRHRMAWLKLHDIAKASPTTGGRRDNYDKCWKASEDCQAEIGRLHGLLAAATESQRRIDRQLRDACIEVVDEVAASKKLESVG